MTALHILYLDSVSNRGRDWENLGASKWSTDKGLEMFAPSALGLEKAVFVIFAHENDGVQAVREAVGHQPGLCMILFSGQGCDGGSETFEPQGGVIHRYKIPIGRTGLPSSTQTAFKKWLQECRAKVESGHVPPWPDWHLLYPSDNDKLIALYAELAFDAHRGALDQPADSQRYDVPALYEQYEACLAGIESRKMRDIIEAERIATRNVLEGWLRNRFGGRRRLYEHLGRLLGAVPD